MGSVTLVQVDSGMVDGAMNDSCFDVVVLSWNRVEETLAAIRSSLAQAGVPITVYVVDQASEADQLEVLRRGTRGLANVHVHYLDRNVGVPAGRNIGAKLGRSEYILFLDNDAELEGEGVCGRLLQRFVEEPSLAVASLLAMNWFTGGLDETSWNHARPIGDWAFQSFFTTRFTGGGFAIRRKDFEAQGGFDPILRFMEEEKDLGYRLIEAGRLILHDPQVRILHKISPERRVGWSSGRTFYLCRNILYCEYKFASSLTGLARATLNVLRIARRKGSTMEGVKGVVAGHLLGLHLAVARRRDMVPLSRKTRDYIDEHETKFYAAAVDS